MKKLTKIKLIFLTILTIFCTQSIAADRIIPIPKPSMDLETKKKISKNIEIYPQKKPLIRQAETESTKQVLETSELQNVNISIYPKKKPTLVKKVENQKIEASEILSKKDFRIAISAFEYISKNKWQTAIKVSKKARDKSLYRLVSYLHLKRPSNTASFYDYT